MKKLKEIWLVFKLYLDTLKNKTTDKSTINATFLLSTPEEVKIWKNLFENFIDKMRNSTGVQQSCIPSMALIRRFPNRSFMFLFRHASDKNNGSMDCPQQISVVL